SQRRAKLTDAEQLLLIGGLFTTILCLLVDRGFRRCRNSSLGRGARCWLARFLAASSRGCAATRALHRAIDDTLLLVQFGGKLGSKRQPCQRSPKCLGGCLLVVLAKVCPRLGAFAGGNTPTDIKLHAANID